MNLHDTIAAVALGVIEGITEFLPVSSTGHLQLAERWLTPQSELFDIVVQCGAVLAVLFVFQRKLLGFAATLHRTTTRNYLGKLFVAFALTSVGVLVAEKLKLKMEKDSVTAAAWAIRVAWATLIGGVLFLAVEWWLRGKRGAEEITWAVAVAAGCAQILAATYSGTSRSGATILFALLLGVTRPAATEFSFLLGVPTLLAAGGYKLFKAWKHHQLSGEPWATTLLATLAAAVVAFVVVKWLVRFVQTRTFVIFGWYRVALAALIFALAGK